MNVLMFGTSEPDGIGAAIRDCIAGRAAMPVCEFTGDINNPDDIDMFLQGVIATPTHVVYSVGINRLWWIGSEYSPHDYSRVMDVNAIGFMRLLEMLVWRWPKTEYAMSVLAVSSDAGERPMRTSMMYCASKAALNMAVRVASRELAPHGWSVNAIAPGKVAGTAMTRWVDAEVLRLRGWSAEYAETYERNSSDIGRPVTTEEVALVATDILFSPPALTGQIIKVNGGR